MNHTESAGANIERLLKSAGVEGNASRQLQNAARNDPAIARAIDKLTERDIAAITALLSDKEAIARIMSSPKANAIIKKLKG